MLVALAVAAVAVGALCWAEASEGRRQEERQRREQRRLGQLREWAEAQGKVLELQLNLALTRLVERAGDQSQDTAEAERLRAARRRELTVGPGAWST